MSFSDDNEFSLSDVETGLYRPKWSEGNPFVLRCRQPPPSAPSLPNAITGVGKAAPIPRNTSDELLLDSFDEADYSNKTVAKKNKKKKTKTLKSKKKSKKNFPSASKSAKKPAKKSVHHPAMPSRRSPSPIGHHLTPNDDFILTQDSDDHLPLSMLGANDASDEHPTLTQSKLVQEEGGDESSEKSSDEDDDRKMPAKRTKATKNSMFGSSSDDEELGISMRPAAKKRDHGRVVQKSTQESPPSDLETDDHTTPVNDSTEASMLPAPSDPASVDDTLDDDIFPDLIGSDGFDSLIGTGPNFFKACPPKLMELTDGGDWQEDDTFQPSSSDRAMAAERQRVRSAKRPPSATKILEPAKIRRTTTPSGLFGDSTEPHPDIAVSAATNEPNYFKASPPKLMVLTESDAWEDQPDYKPPPLVHRLTKRKSKCTMQRYSSYSVTGFVTDLTLEEETFDFSDDEGGPVPEAPKPMGYGSIPLEDLQIRPYEQQLRSMVHDGPETRSELEVMKDSVLNMCRKYGQTPSNFILDQVQQKGRKMIKFSIKNCTDFKVMYESNLDSKGQMENAFSFARRAISIAIALEPELLTTEVLELYKPGHMFLFLIQPHIVTSALTSLSQNGSTATTGMSYATSFSTLVKRFWETKSHCLLQLHPDMPREQIENNVKDLLQQILRRNSKLRSKKKADANVRQMEDSKIEEGMVQIIPEHMQAHVEETNARILTATTQYRELFYGSDSSVELGMFVTNQDTGEKKMRREVEKLLWFTAQHYGANVDGMRDQLFEDILRAEVAISVKSRIRDVDRRHVRPKEEVMAALVPDKLARVLDIIGQWQRSPDTSYLWMERFPTSSEKNGATHQNESHRWNFTGGSEVIAEFVPTFFYHLLPRLFAECPTMDTTKFLFHTKTLKALSRMDLYHIGCQAFNHTLKHKLGCVNERFLCPKKPGRTNQYVGRWNNFRHAYASWQRHLFEKRVGRYANLTYTQFVELLAWEMHTGQEQLEKHYFTPNQRALKLLMGPAEAESEDVTQGRLAAFLSNPTQAIQSDRLEPSGGSNVYHVAGLPIDSAWMDRSARHTAHRSNVPAFAREPDRNPMDRVLPTETRPVYGPWGDGPWEEAQRVAETVLDPPERTGRQLAPPKVLFPGKNQRLQTRYL